MCRLIQSNFEPLFRGKVPLDLALICVFAISTRSGASIG
jgi:hypothetical protein